MPNLRGIESIPEIKSFILNQVLNAHDGTRKRIIYISIRWPEGMFSKTTPRRIFSFDRYDFAGNIYISRCMAEESRRDMVQFRMGKRRLPSAEPLTVLNALS